MTVDCLVREYRDRTAALSTGAPSQAHGANPQRWDTGDNATMSVLNHVIYTSTRMTFAHGTYLDMELIGTGRVTDDLAGTPDGTVQADIYRITYPSNPLLDNGRDHLCRKPITFFAIWEPEVERQLGYGPNREVEYYTILYLPRCGPRGAGFRPLMRRSSAVRLRVSALFRLYQAAVRSHPADQEWRQYRVFHAGRGRRSTARIAAGSRRGIRQIT
jgi:hypothetical protein